MTRYFVWVLVLFAIAVGTMASAHPARPLYEPPETTKPAPVVFLNLVGTAWLGKYGVAARTYVFEADGTISYKSATPTIFKNRGSWRLEGQTIYFDHHIGIKGKKTLEFRGVVKDANTIVGEQLMVNTGMKTTVIMQRTVIGVK